MVLIVMTWVIAGTVAHMAERAYWALSEWAD